MDLFEACIVTYGTGKGKNVALKERFVGPNNILYALWARVLAIILISILYITFGLR